jgi:hypothetical protein
MIHHHLDKYIDDFANLPELIIKEDYKDIIHSPDEKLFSSKEQQLIDKFHLRNQIVAFRLKLAIDVDKGYSVENSNHSIEFLGNLFKSEEEFYKYLDSNYIRRLAHLVWMDYQLIKEAWGIYNSTGFALSLQLTKQIESIEHWWWLIQCERTRNGMKQVGLLGENPKITGKREYTDFNKVFIDAIDPSKDLSISRLLDKDTKGNTKGVSASEALELICFNLIYILSDDKRREFEHDVYQQWVDAQRSFNSAIRKDASIKPVYLIAHEIIIQKKHQKASEKHKKFKRSMKIPDDVPKEFRYLISKSKKKNNRCLED